MKKKIRLMLLLSLVFLLPVISMLIVSTSCTQQEVPPRPTGPGDIYNTAGFPCVTAHSTTRALFSTYNGPLYQVMRQSDGKTLDIGVVKPSAGDPGGYADAAAQDDFCENSVCWITTIYDQSGNNNHLVQAPPGTFVGPHKGGFNELPIADMAPVTIMGQKVYGTYIMPGMGLRNNDATGLGINDEPEGIYMVFDGTHFDSGCCFNYGNTSANSRAVGRATMSTVYFGTSTAWGSGAGTGPWIMSDMEAGLFSGYNTKVNEENPTIDSWRFVTGMVNGGGGNQWEIRGGDAQNGELSVFYKGIRPQSLENSNYYPMHKKGSVQLGNGGDNGNGSSGTFYEGIMTKGYPTDDAINAVQKNIVAAGYDVPAVSLSHVITFTPVSTQQVEFTYTNTTGVSVSDVKLSVDVPSGWSSVLADTKDKSKKLSGPISAGETVNVTFSITSPTSTSSGYLKGKAEWKNERSKGKKSVTNSQRIRNVVPVKINEVRFNTSSNPSNQFIELHNASENEVDISNWMIINTKSEWAPIKLAVIPSNTKLAANDFYLLGLANSGLASPAAKGSTTINVLNTSGFEAGEQITIGDEKHTIKSVGTPASDMTMIFVPVSTGPWITIPAGSTNIPVINVAGFVVGQKMAIDIGGSFEEVTVTEIGKASTLTNLAVAAKAGDNTIKVTANSNMTVGDTLTIGTGSRKEKAVVKRIVNVVETPVRRGFGQGGNTNNEPGEVELSAPLKYDHMLDVDVSDRGTGISFTPATQYDHKSGEAVQALGSGIELENKLEKYYELGAPVVNSSISTTGFQGKITPNQWYGAPLSSAAGSIALLDASGKVIVDGMVYGSQQSNSSANGTIATPVIATLEGNQSQGGCIVVVSSSNRNFGASSATETNKSYGLFPDGADNDDNCNDFESQNTISILTSAEVGTNNIKVSNVANLRTGQEIIIGSGPNQESVIIAEVGTAGGTALASTARAGSTQLLVGSVEGFNTGQTITINSGAIQETAIIASTAASRRRFGAAGNNPTDTITVATSLKNNHAAGTTVSGSGIMLSNPLAKAHASGTQLTTGLPTPGEPNKF
ncbi:MAG: lamin tail domain-containing protein [Prolixibacteraceae bacterium]|nr:lamin tail domain-containing protein [Prolixibacteraceae bacterium]